MGEYFTLEDEAKEQFFKIPKVFMMMFLINRGI